MYPRYSMVARSHVHTIFVEHEIQQMLGGVMLNTVDIFCYTRKRHASIKIISILSFALETCPVPYNV